MQSLEQPKQAKQFKRIMAKEFASCHCFLMFLTLRRYRKARVLSACVNTLILFQTEEERVNEGLNQYFSILHRRTPYM